MPSENQSMRSLPTRERELKLRLHAEKGLTCRSLPTRERELKPGPLPDYTPPPESLPTRERELKHFVFALASERSVAPHAGA